jgi:L-threonylcarbamoyladenylate synthase
METIIGNDINKVIELLQENNVVAIPTETVYGLAGNALHEDAVTKIYAAKNRPAFNPLILHISGIDELTKYAELDEISKKLAHAFMPGPLTLLLPKKSIVPDITTAGSDKVALRVPNHSLTIQLLQKLPFPLAAPSANPSGYISPTTATHVYQGLQGKIPYILDGGATSVGLESTIIEVQQDHILLHRTGGIDELQIEAVSGLKVLIPQEEAVPETPGQLKSHYAPHTPLYRGDIKELITENRGKKIAIISFTNHYKGENITCYTLSSKEQLSEAANQLFATLREIDGKNYDIILAEYFPTYGIGTAINDRIRRAQFVLK